MGMYTPTIGLEIHAELKTLTKLFCNSRNDPDEKRPNVNICPICLGHPGTLPVLNKTAVKHVLKIGRALGGEFSDVIEFDRKNYFYPDIPKGYQISQYKYPLVSGGSLRNVAITRVHLEEDTARSIHQEGKSYSLIDFNRAGIPLMELVTDPVMRSASDASDFAREFQLLLRYLGASEANMEKGEMRVEANVSVSSDEKKGTKVEVKNLNSFRSVERAIEYEIKRQTELLENGGSIIQETRGWDEKKQQTFPQRLKEGSEDYRYFPEPDLPKLKLFGNPDFKKQILEDEMPELPDEKRSRYKEMFGIKDEDIDVFVNSDAKDATLHAAIKGNNGKRELVQAVVNYITVEIPAIAKKQLEEYEDSEIDYDPAHLMKIAIMKEAGEISSRGVKDILAEMLKNGGDPDGIAKRKGLFQKSDTDELEKIVDEIIKEHVQVSADYRAGKKAALQFLVGQGMKITKGSANPEILQALLAEKLH